MTVNSRCGVFIFVSSLFAFSCFAQQPAPGTEQQPANNGNPDLPQQIVKQQKPPEEPAVLEDGGLSIEPIYWLNRAQPDLKGGATATGFGSIDYSGNANYSIGGELSFPAGHSNTLRISYFRVQGNSNTTLTQDASFFGEAYNTGDYLSYGYRLQNAKISWDYLSYTWHKPSGNIRLKTLYEVQYDTISSTFYAPFKPVTTDASGNTDTNIGNGSHNVILPTFGLELEEALGRHFRWEVKGSGFGLPYRSDIWDAQADIAVRFGSVEVLGGERAYHFKSSPKGNEYFADTLSGAYVGVRYYWGHPR